MATAGLYRRVLPSPPAIDFASSEGKKLFSEALQNGTMEGFFKLISYFQTQSEPAYCGLASLSVVLNALAIDPGRKWKGPWRWFDETMLDCCEPLERIKAQGITFGKVACLAQCAGAKVEVFRANQSTINDFRKHVIACTSSENCHLITSYHRASFKQTGGGHFSPIGGYHGARDMALILDVARFKYPPHWVPLSLLWEAMKTVDEATGHFRGFMLISKFQKVPSLLYTLSCSHENWRKASKYLIEDVPVRLKSTKINSIQNVFSAIFTCLPAEVGEFIKWVAEVRRQEGTSQSLSQEEKLRLDAKGKMLQLVQETKLFQCLTQWLHQSNVCCNVSSSCSKSNLCQVAASVCCQGAEIMTRSTNVGPCCKATCIQNLKTNGSCRTLVSGTVVTDDGEEDFDVLVPVSPMKSSCNDFHKRHPDRGDVFTILLLALPSSTWYGLKDEHLFNEVHCLVSNENLSDELREEVMHLRRQLCILRKCQNEKADDDLDTCAEYCG